MAASLFFYSQSQHEISRRKLSALLQRILRNTRRQTSVVVGGAGGSRHSQLVGVLDLASLPVVGAAELPGGNTGGRYHEVAKWYG